ncbi:MAG: hypothetical protein ACK5TU_08420, partial [Cyclobacteriaceae bacterium]
MKAFAIFPTICVFILTFSILKSQSDLGTKKNLFWSLTTMVIFCGLVIGILTTLKQEELAGFAFLLMLSNVVFALVLIPILTFLMNDWIPTTTGTMRWSNKSGHKSDINLCNHGEEKTTSQIRQPVQR